MRRWEVYQTLGKTAIICTATVLCIYYGVYQPIAISHGETTTVRFLMDWMAEIKANVVLAWGATAASLLWGKAQRGKRLRERRERDDRIAALEKQIDPNRSSSGLGTDGSMSAEQN
jgi:hypothetical protein